MPHSFATALSSAQRSVLKGRAHALRPIVQVGASGLTPTVFGEIARALETHELVKVQLPGQNSAGEKKDALTELSAGLPPHAHVVSRIGRTVIIYLEKDPTEASITVKSLGRSAPRAARLTH